MAATVITYFIDQRDSDADDPLTLPAIDQDPIGAERLRAAYLLARGLASSMEGASLEQVRNEAERLAASLVP